VADGGRIGFLVLGGLGQRKLKHKCRQLGAAIQTVAPDMLVGLRNGIAEVTRGVLIDESERKLLLPRFRPYPLHLGITVGGASVHDLWVARNDLLTFHASSRLGTWVIK